MQLKAPGDDEIMVEIVIAALHWWKKFHPGAISQRFACENLEKYMKACQHFPLLGSAFNLIDDCTGLHRLEPNLDCVAAQNMLMDYASCKSVNDVIKTAYQINRSERQIEQDYSF